MRSEDNMDKCQGCGLELTEELISQKKCPLCGHNLSSDQPEAPQPQQPVVGRPTQTPVSPVSPNANAPNANGPDDEPNAGPMGTLDASQFPQGEGADSPFSYNEKTGNENTDNGGTGNDTALPTQTLDPSSFRDSPVQSDAGSTLPNTSNLTKTGEDDAENAAIAPIELPPDEGEPADADGDRDANGDLKTGGEIKASGDPAQTIVQGETQYDLGDSPNIDQTIVKPPTIVDGDDDSEAGQKKEKSDTVSYDAKNLPRDLRQVRSAESDSDVKNMWKTFNNSKISPKMSIKVDNQVQRVKDGLAIHRRSVRTSEDVDAEEADYQLIRFVGEGGMGTVYEAKQGSVQRSVAIKTLKPELAKKRDNREKFLYEAHITGDLDHPNIVPIHELGANDDGTLFYSMKLVTGTPWEEVIRNKSRKENIEILMKVADAISFAHSRQIIHRDLKPENIMLGQFGEVLVMDWGLAIHLKNKDVLTLGGTPAYMAPEMARHQISKIGIQSDIYLLGAILYESIAGYPPHPGRTITECVSAAAQNQIIECDVHEDELFSIALRAMDSEPSRRYQTVISLQNALRDYESHAESINLAVRAGTDLEEAQSTSNYNAYARALFGYRDAVELWPENLAAGKGLVEARIAYATQAYNNKDYDLGLSLLDSRNAEEAALVEKLKKGKADQDARDRRFKIARTAAVGFLLTAFAIALGAFLLTQELRNSERQATQDLGKQVKKTKDALDKAVIEEDKAIKAKAKAIKSESIAKKQKTAADVAKQGAVDALAESEKLTIKLKKVNTDLSSKTKELVIKTNEAVAAKASAETAKGEAEKNAAIAIEQTLKAQGLLKNSIFGAFQAKLSLADAQIEDANIERALMLLEEAKQLDTEELELSENLLNWAWYRLKLLCHDEVPTVDSSSPVVKTSVSADGKLTAFATQSGEMFVYDIATIKKRDPNKPNPRPLNQPWKAPVDSTIHDIAVAPNGQFVVFCTDVPKATVVVWNRANGKYTAMDAHDGESVDAVAVSPDSQTVATGGIKGITNLWAATGGQLKSAPAVVLPSAKYLIRSLDFSADGKQLAATASRGARWRSNLWDLTNNKLVGQFTHVRELSNSVVLPGSRFVAAGQINGDLLVWEISKYPFRAFGSTAPAPTTTAFVELAGLHSKKVAHLSLDSSGSRMLTCGADAAVKVWTLPADVTTLQQWGQIRPEQTIRGHGEEVVSADFVSTNKIVSGSFDKSTRVWDLLTYREEIQIPVKTDVPLTHSVPVAGERVVAVDEEGVVHFIDTNTSKPLGNMSIGHAKGAQIRGLFHAETNQVITSGDDGTTCVWDAASGLQRFRWGNTSRSPAIAVTSGKNAPPLLITAGDENIPNQVWDLGDKFKRVAEFSTNAIYGENFTKPGNKLIQEMEVTPNGRYLVVSNPAKRVAVWDLVNKQSHWVGDINSGELLTNSTDRISEVIVSPTGESTFAISDTGVVLTWSIQSENKPGQYSVVRIPTTIPRPGSASADKTVGNANLDFVSTSNGQHRLLASWMLKSKLSADDNKAAETTLCIWDTSVSLDPVKTISVPFEVVDTTAIAPGKVALADTKGRMFIWNFEENVPPKAADQSYNVLAAVNANIGTVDLELTDNRILSVGPERAVIFDIASKATVPFGRVESCKFAGFDSQNKSMVSVHVDGSAWIWDTSQGLVNQSPLPLSRKNGKHLSAQLSPDGTQLLSISQKPNEAAKLLLWSRDQQQVKEIAANVTAAVWSSDGRAIVVANANNGMQMINAATLEVAATPTTRLTSKALEIKVAPGGEYFATLMENGEVSVMFQSSSILDKDTENGGAQDPPTAVTKVWTSYTVKVSPDTITDFAISPIAAGSQLVTGDDKGSLTVWQVSTDDDRARELMVLRGHGGSKITSVEFSANGRTIVTGDAKGKSIVWLSAGWEANEPAEGNNTAAD
jgi:WD40 repeat protein